MLFSSFEFLLAFLPVTIVVYFQLNRRMHDWAGKSWLLIASLFFYGWWSLDYLWLIAGSTLFNYAAARSIDKRNSVDARLMLAAAVACNLGLLAYYKYADFFIVNINSLTDSHLNLLQLALPLGISFFTFTQIAFLVDVYRGQAREHNLLHYCLFVTYFPHLIAGPILHHREMMPQFACTTKRDIDWRNIHLGMLLIGLGLLKKVALADSLAHIANEGFSTATNPLFHQAWMTSLAYTLQLYFDFSGYTDMAIGSALLCNIRLPENFHSPYKAVNIRDFWRRWHITLSRWLRDYLYIPLGGNRYGRVRSHFALMITFILGGLWHGASWTFVIWGVLHGSAAALHKGWQTTGMRLPTLLGWLLTFLFVNATWVFFRADSLNNAIVILQGMVGLHGFAPSSELTGILTSLMETETWNPLMEASSGRRLLLLITALLIALLAPGSQAITEKLLSGPTGILSAITTGIITGLGLFYTLFMTSGISPFIYFYF